MMEFFRGWKRKVGTLILVMACLCAMGWVRSFTDQDVFVRLNNNETHLVVSMNGCVWWERIWPIMTPRQSRSFYKNSKTTVNSDNTWDDCDIHWNITGLGFDFRTYSKWQAVGGVAPYTQEYALWQLPYWSVTIPLTLISVWLLLSKSRSSTQKKIMEPEADEGGATS